MRGLCGNPIHLPRGPKSVTVGSGGLVASGAAGVELLVSAKSVLSSYKKNLRNSGTGARPSAHDEADDGEAGEVTERGPELATLTQTLIRAALDRVSVRVYPEVRARIGDAVVRPPP